MRIEYHKPVFVELGHISALTEANNAVYESDMPGGQGNPYTNGRNVLGS